MFKQKRSKKIHNPNNSTTQEFSDTSVDSDMVLLNIPISYPATPLNVSYQPPAILLSAIEEKIFQQQQENDNGSKDSLSLKQEEVTWMKSFWELESKYLQLSESYKNVLQENLRVQTENIKLEQELELSRKNTADLEIRLHGFQSGANIFQKQYFMLQKQNIQLVKRLYELQSTLTNVPFTQIDSTQQQNSISTLEEYQQNPQIVSAYENVKHNRRRYGDGNKSKSTVIVPHQHEPSLHQQASYEDLPHPPYKDPPVQHVPSQQQHMPYEVSTYQHAPYKDPLPQHAPDQETEATNVIIPENAEAASSSNTPELQYLPTIQYISDSYNLLRLVKLQYEHLAKHHTAKLKYISI